MFAGQAAKRRLGGLARIAVCPLRTLEGRKGQTANCKSHTSKDTREVANLSYTALAACRITLAGAAETGARSRHASFDPIRVFGAVLGDTDTGGAATRTNPVHFEAVQIRTGGRSKSERRYPDSAGGLTRPQKCGRGMRGNLDCSAPRGNAWVSG